MCWNFKVLPCWNLQVNTSPFLRMLHACEVDIILTACMEATWSKKWVSPTRLAFLFQACKHLPTKLQIPPLPLFFKFFYVCLIASLLINLELKLSFPDSSLWYPSSKFHHSVLHFPRSSPVILLLHPDSLCFSCSSFLLLQHVFLFLSLQGIYPTSLQYLTSWVSSQSVSSLEIRSMFRVI